VHDAHGCPASRVRGVVQQLRRGVAPCKQIIGSKAGCSGKIRAASQGWRNRSKRRGPAWRWGATRRRSPEGTRLKVRCSVTQGHASTGEEEEKVRSGSPRSRGVVDAVTSAVVKFTAATAWWRWWRDKLLCFGLRPLVDGLLCYSPGSGFRVPYSGKAAWWRRARWFLFSFPPPPLFSLSPSWWWAEKPKGKSPSVRCLVVGASPGGLEAWAQQGRGRRVTDGRLLAAARRVADVAEHQWLAGRATRHDARVKGVFPWAEHTRRRPRRARGSACAPARP
jgi:hypothetical protein